MFTKYYFISARCVSKTREDYVSGTVTTKKSPTLDDLVGVAKIWVPSAESILILSSCRLTRSDYLALKKNQTLYKKINN